MSGMGHKFAGNSNVLVGTVNLWKLRRQMPLRMHETRKFTVEEDGTKFVCILNISKTYSFIEEYRYVDEKMCGYTREKVSDLYYEDGNLVVDTKKGILSA